MMKFKEGTVSVSKVYKHPKQNVFAAWTQEDAQRIWGDPGPDWHMTFDRFNCTVGGSDLCRFGPVDGPEYVNENRYLVIDPLKQIIYATSLRSEGQLVFAGTVVISFESVNENTKVNFVEHGLYFEDRDQVEGHRSGWIAMLDGIEKYLSGQGCI